MNRFVLLAALERGGSEVCRVLAAGGKPSFLPDSERDAMAGEWGGGGVRPRSPFPGGWSHRFSCLRPARPTRRRASRSCRWRTGTPRRGRWRSRWGSGLCRRPRGLRSCTWSPRRLAGFYRPGHHTCEDERGYFGPKTQPAKYISPSLETSYQGCYFSCQDDKENAGPKLRGWNCPVAPLLAIYTKGFPRSAQKQAGLRKV